MKAPETAVAAADEGPMPDPSSTPVSAPAARLARLRFRLRTLGRRLVCLVRGHRYPHYVINNWSLYFCANGCGREYLRGYLTAAQFVQAMDDLPPRPDDADEYGWSEELDA